MTTPQKPPVAATDIKEAWTDIVREIVIREGRAVRAAAHRPIIEIKSLSTNLWHPLGLPGGGTEFLTYDDRNLIIKKIQ